MSTQSIRLARTNTLSPAVLICIAVMVALVAFSGGLLELVRRWSAQEEYSHGFLIPVVAAWMLWSRRDAVFASVGRPSWIGVLLISVAGMMLIVGELSAFYLLSQLGFVVVLLGIVLAIGGISLLKVTFIPIAFLVFAIPLPYFIDSELSWRLQLISSDLGVFFIRLFGVPVHLTGNIIDLGNYKLQVVEACSGLALSLSSAKSRILGSIFIPSAIVAAGGGVHFRHPDYHRYEQFADCHRRCTCRQMGD